MNIHQKPTDTKHPAVLPVGKEIIFKIKKDHMILKAADGDNKQTTYPGGRCETEFEVSSAKSNNP